MCREHLDELPASFAEGPAVWMGTAHPGEPLTPFDHTWLCLHGFDPDATVDITVSTGEFTARTTADARTPHRLESLHPHTLFTDRDHIWLDRDEEPGFLLSNMWTLAPAERLLAEMVREGRLTLTATQGAVTAVFDQPVAPRTIPGREALSGLHPSVSRIIIWGFRRGTEVPVGLYRKLPPPDGYASGPAELVEQLASVRMGQSWSAEYTVPEDLLHRVPPGDYCVTVPLDEQFNCPSATNWDPYPGKARRGDRGDTVRDWQHLLVQAGELEDTAANTDGMFGADLEAVVRRLQVSLGLTPDGIAGPATYARLTGLPHPVEPTPQPE